MISAILISVLMVASPLVKDGTEQPDQEAYRAAAAKAGKNAEAHARLALWCEAHGLSRERLEQLSRAIECDPANALARGLSGLVSQDGAWRRPEEVARQIQDTPGRQAAFQEYLRRRERTADNAAAQMKLAAWCDDQGLKAEARAHYYRTIRLDPSRESAWKRLGFRRQGTRWLKPDEIAAAKQETVARQQAEKRWTAKLQKLRDDLQAKDPAKRAEAEDALAAVHDPYSVPVVWALFVRGNERRQLAGVRILTAIDSPVASRALAALAVFSPSLEVRRRATEAVAKRDPRDCVGRLIAMIHKPIEYEVPKGNGSGRPGNVLVAGQPFDFQRISQSFGSAWGSDGLMGWDQYGATSSAFDPFSIRNVVTAMLGQELAFAANYQLGTVLGPGGLAAQFPVMPAAPISSQSSAAAAQAIAANPQNATAILNQLVNNPANRTAPPALWFMIMNQHVPANPMHAAMVLQHLDQVALSPANLQANAALQTMIIAQGQAAQAAMEAERERAAIRQINQQLQQQVALQVQMIEVTNRGIAFYNERVLPVLRAITGMNFGAEPEKWRAWWKQQLGAVEVPVASTSKPPGRYQTQAAGPTRAYGPCLAAGTLVNTLGGPRPVETLATGDRVLAQNAATGALSFQPVLSICRVGSVPIQQIRAGNQSIAVTDTERMWKAGKGWTLAPDLKPGDQLRIFGGVVAIESIRAGDVAPAHNIEVADDHDFFAGNSGLLVHDFGFASPPLRPFDTPTEMPAPTAPARSATR